LTAAIASIVDEHRHRNDIDTTEVVIQHIARRVAELLDDKLTRIRLGVNNADRNSDIIIMLLNTLLGYQELTSLITEDTPQLQRAREIEKERLQNFREKKLDREAKKANKTPEIIPDELIME
jgi:cell division protein ZapA (FtsZ GTPase activity inhibitor)